MQLYTVQPQTQASGGEWRGRGGGGGGEEEGSITVCTAFDNRTVCTNLLMYSWLMSGAGPITNWPFSGTLTTKSSHLLQRKGTATVHGGLQATLLRWHVPLQGHLSLLRPRNSQSLTTVDRKSSPDVFTAEQAHTAEVTLNAFLPLLG